MSSLTVEEDQKWLPTSVQVTVLRGRGLRGKGKHGTSDVYTIIQLGKEKYSTGVAEKTTEPEWREECSFELQPGVLESGCPAGSNELVLTVMHRALIGMDVFLGQAVIRLDELFHQTRSSKNEWYRLNSKTGKKEKERGEIQLSVQFTRNNLTASMYDLVMKDKSASTFSKLKEHMRGKRRSSDKDSSSAVLPSGYGSLYRMRQRLPSDGGGEEDYEDDEGGEARRSKMRTFFLRGKLRKSSDTRSSTSLGSESSESSSRGGSLSPTAGISVVVSDLSNSPSNSSNLTADNSPEHTANTSPKSSSLKCEFGDEDVGEITIAVPQPTVCVNGSHAYNVQPLDPGSGNPAGSSGLGLLHKSLPLSMSLQNLTPRASPDVPGGPAGDGRRWSFDKPGEEEKAAIAAALEKSGPMLSEEEEQEERLRQAAPSKAASAPAAESEVQGRKQKRNLFSLGRSEPTGKSASQQEAAAAAEEKHKGWFASKELHSKPSTDPHPPPLPPNHPNSPPVGPPSAVSSLHHTNPFCQSQNSPPPISRCNPFFSLLQHNPFYGDNMQTTEHLRPLLPPLPYLSSARPPIAQLFPQAGDPRSVTTTRNQPDTDVGSDMTRDATAIARRRPLPPPPPPTEKPSLLRKSSNPFTTAEELGGDPEWDESFEAFAACRLQSPEDRAAESRTQQTASRDRPPERRSHQGAEADELRHQTFPLNKVADQATSFPALHFDALPLMLETIPEHRSFESDDTNFSDPNAAETETKPPTSTTNDLTDTNVQQAPCQTFAAHLHSSSPDASSSGIGSSADEDFLSYFSSQSDKFSASSSEETENNILSFEKQTVVKPRSGTQDETTDGSTDPSLDDAAHQTVIRRENSNLERADLSSGEGSFAVRSLVNSHSQPVFTTETRTEGVDTQTLPIPNNLVPDLFPKSFNSLKSEEDKDIPDISCGDFITDLKIGASELSSCPSSLNSSPVEQRFLDLSCEGAGEPSFVDSFDVGHISNPANLKDCDISSQSSSSFLQNLNVSCDSQDYQTCESRPPSKCSEVSEPNETLRSAVSTLCADLDNSTTSTASLSGLEGPAKWLNVQSDGFEDSLSRSEMLEAIAAPPAGLADSLEGRRPNRLSEEAQHDPISGDHPQDKATLQRSQSEGTLAPILDNLRPSFGSDPGAIQLSSLTPQSPGFPSLPSFAPCLTSASRTSPVALCTFPPLAKASPTGAAQVSTPPSQETEQQHQHGFEWHNSPHPVKPLTTAMLTEEKRSVLATGLEKLKSTIHPGRSSSGGSGGSQSTDPEADKKKPLTEGAGSYYHLTHSELVALLVQREAELRRQKAEFERQKLLLAKREVELRRLKPQVRDLEDYIDTLLVRIMEQKPTLLQVRTKLK